MKIALVCDWLTGMRGGERCLEAVCELYPDADIFTLVHFPGTVSKTIESHTIHTSYIQKLPGDVKKFRRYLPLFGHAIRQFDLTSYDCVLSFSHCIAKGVKVPKGIPHICYCHTPMRYTWFMRDEYLSAYKGPKKWVTEIMLDYLKNWDKETSEEVTHFIANSKNVQNRIKKCYHRDSQVVYPPVDCDKFYISQRNDGYYLIVSALVPYKRIDLAVKAFNKLERKLIIIGSGPELENLKSYAGSNIVFTGWISDKEVTNYMENCSALIFPGEEDFGIVPLEAQACGKAVIAFAAGGALETIKGLDSKPGVTGIFFNRQSEEDLRTAVLEFERKRYLILPHICRENALNFVRNIFKRKIKAFLDDKI
jgi:glycosyltransferase involved in cell wall biosynthesis